MTHKEIFVFGNPDLEIDSLPIQLLGQLREAFPHITFTTLDPNEEWDVPTNMLVIDTVVNIKEITVFEDLDVFMAAPRMTCHDFDAYSNLMFMKKLGKIDSVYIIGVPPSRLEDASLPELNEAIKTALKKEY